MKELLLFAPVIIFFVISSGCIIQTEEDQEIIYEYKLPPNYKTYDEKTKLNYSELAQEIHNLVNIERQNYNLSPLEYDHSLAYIASSHSWDMAMNNFFDHYNLEGQGPTERAIEAGYSLYKEFGDGYYTEGIAENLFQNSLYDSEILYVDGYYYDWNTQSEIASSTVEGWMNSPEHRDNILDPSYDKEGIGISETIGFDFEVYITQNFW